MTLLQRKVSKILTQRVDTPDISLALKGLSEFYGENTLKTRRKLRSNIEKRGLGLNKQLIVAFKDVEQELKIIEQSINGLDAECEQLSKRLTNARSNTEHLIEKTELLRLQRLEIETKSEIATNFLSRFHLTDEESEILEHTTVDRRIFAVLDRIVEIRNDCKDLLQTYHQRVGLDIMDQLSLRSENGYEKVYRWTQKQCRLFDVDSGFLDLSSVPSIEEPNHPEHNHDESKSSSLIPSRTQNDIQRLESTKEQKIPTDSRDMPNHPDIPNLAVFSMALKLLETRPAYFDFCVQEVASTRRVYIVRKFIDALTKNGAKGTPKPIDIHSHDPLRYVSDIMAWIHQTVANERELIFAIFSIEDSKRGINVIRVDCDAHNSDPEQVTQFLDRSFEGIAHPLEVRVNQILISQSDVVLVYKLLNVLEFYSRTIDYLFSSLSSLRKTLLSLKASASKQFYTILDENSQSLLTNPPTYNPNLSPVKLVKDTVAQLTSILEAYSRSLVPLEQKDEDFSPILSAILDPLQDAISKSTTGLDESDNAVGHINAFAHIQDCLFRYNFTQTRYETLALSISMHLDTLINAQTTLILRKAGVTNTVTLMAKYREKLKLRQSGVPEDELNSDKCSSYSQNTDGIEIHTVQENTESSELGLKQSVVYESMSSAQGLDENSMMQVMSSFCSFLFSLGAMLMPQCDRILDPQLRRKALDSVCVNVFETYNDIYNTILDPKNKYSFVETFSMKRPDEVKALLGS